MESKGPRVFFVAHLCLPYNLGDNVMKSIVWSTSKTPKTAKGPRIHKGHGTLGVNEIWVFPKIWENPPNHPIKNRVFHYKPSILVVFPLFLVQHPYKNAN